MVENAERLNEQMEEMIRWPLQERESVTRDEETGQIVAVTLRPVQWNKNTIKRYFDIIQIVSGGVTERADQQLNEDGSTILDLSPLSIEERVQLEELLERVGGLQHPEAES
jgi:hypothetical protein